MAEILTLGAARVVNPDGTPCPPVVRVLLEIGANDIEDRGEVPFFGALGITAKPAPSDDSGHAEGVFIREIGIVGGIIAATDTRCAGVAGELAPGDTAMHSTGPTAATRAKMFCKTNSASMLVGNDTAFVMDRANKAITMNMPEAGQLELSKANGFMVGDSAGTGLQVKGGKILINGGQVSIPGGIHIGGAGAQPLVLSVGLLSYFTALEALLSTIAAATTPPTTAAVTAFSSAMATTKTAMTALFTNGK